MTTPEIQKTSGTRPTFINIGPGRCATSWLHQSLTAHPEIEMASVKETEFFNTFTDRTTQWYESHFPNQAAAIGEISSNYYLDPEVPARIKRYDPSINIVINLRNPYSLMQSFYDFGVRRGIELNDLKDSTETPIGSLMGSGFANRKKNGNLTTSDKVTLLESVCLHDRLKPFIDAFPRAQIHFFVFEELQDNWEGSLRSLYSFLGVDSGFTPPDAGKIVNSSVAPKSVFVARLATRTASVLRRMGMYRTLSKLHKSEAIKKILFRSKEAESGLSSIRNSLDDAVVAKIDAQIALLRKLHPALAQYWEETEHNSEPQNDD